MPWLQQISSLLRGSHHATPFRGDVFSPPDKFQNQSSRNRHIFPAFLRTSSSLSLLKLSREKTRRVLASLLLHIFPLTPRINRLVHFTKLGKRNRSTMHKFRMEFRDRPRVSICSGTITPTDNRGYFHKITTQIRVSWPCTRPCLPSAISSPLAPIDPCARACVHV